MKNKLSTLVVTIAAVMSIAGVMAYNGSKMQQHLQKPPEQSQPVYPDVAVFTSSKGEFQAQIEGFGEATAKYSLALSSEVAGRVEEFARNFDSGAEFKQGEILLRLNKVAYEQAVASARAEVAQAKLEWLEEQRQAEQAQAEWQSSGLDGEPDSPLVLRQPQLDAAQANLLNAKASLANAQRELDLTDIRAPFDAVIVSREVEPGSYVQQGGTVATLDSTQQVEIRIPLSAYQWQNLPAFNQRRQLSWPATITSTQGAGQWSGYVDRVEQHIDSTTRQRSLVVVVDHPLQQEPALLPGTFVKVTVAGRPLADVWQVPATAVTQDNMVWYVNEQHQLARFVAQKQFEKADAVYILPPDGMDSAAIVARPLNTYTQGMVVNPVKGGQS